MKARCSSTCSPTRCNKLYANLGQAYVASGQMQKAVNAFDESIADKTYFLSDSASVDYQRAIAAVAQGTSEITQVMAPVAPVADMSGLDVLRRRHGRVRGSGSVRGGRPGTVLLRRSSRPGRDEPLRRPGRGGSFLQRQRRRAGAVVERGLAKTQDRKRRNVGLKILVTIILIVLVAQRRHSFLPQAGASVAGWWSRQLFSDRKRPSPAR